MKYKILLFTLFILTLLYYSLFSAFQKANAQYAEPIGPTCSGISGAFSLQVGQAAFYTATFGCGTGQPDCTANWSATTGDPTSYSGNLSGNFNFNWIPNSAGSHTINLSISDLSGTTSCPPYPVNVTEGPPPSPSPTPPPPPAPGAFTATATPSCSGSTSIITLSWGTSSDATSYTVSRSPTRSGLPVSTTSLGYVDNIVTASTSYTYTVTANNISGSRIATGPSPITALNCAGASPSPSTSPGASPSPSPSSAPSATPGGSGSPWIQTTGGDVHSNERIQTPGGP